MKREERLNDIETSLQLMLSGTQAKLWTAMPGVVSEVNLGDQTLSVQPAIQGVITSKDGTQTTVNLPLLVDVPIVWPRAGGFSLTFPIQAGDEVLVVFSSRCIDTWWENGGVGVQAEARMHDLSDGFAILAPTSQPKKISGVSTDSVQLRNDNGDAYVEINTSGNVRIVSGSEVDISAPNVNINCTDADVTASGDAKINGDTVEVIGSTQIDLTAPNIIVTGSMDITGGVSIDGIPFDTHRHTGVQSGPSLTGGPV